MWIRDLSASVYRHSCISAVCKPLLCLSAMFAVVSQCCQTYTKCTCPGTAVAVTFSSPGRTKSLTKRFLITGPSASYLGTSAGVHAADNTEPGSSVSFQYKLLSTKVYFNMLSVLSQMVSKALLIHRINCCLLVCWDSNFVTESY